MPISVAGTIPALAATVTVLDQSGKVVNTSKNIFGAFKEAREAYRIRKAEIAAERQAEKSARRAIRHDTRIVIKAERKAQKNIGKLEGRKDKSSKTKAIEQSPYVYDYDDDEEEEEGGEGSALYAISRGSQDSERTEGTIYLPGALSNMAALSVASLAPSMLGDPALDTLQNLVLQLQGAIDELSCITASLTTLITELQKCPDTLAVVGLTLAEISTIVAKVAPGALVGLKSAFPVIFALLASPQFAVIAGVGAVGTVIVLGGYKIIRDAFSGGDENYKEPEEVEMDGFVEGEVFEHRLIEPAPVPEPVSLPPPRPVRALTAPPAPGLMEKIRNKTSSSSSSSSSSKKEKEKESDKDLVVVKKDKKPKSQIPKLISSATFPILPSSSSSKSETLAFELKEDSDDAAKKQRKKYKSGSSGERKKSHSEKSRSAESVVEVKDKVKEKTKDKEKSKEKVKEKEKVKDKEKVKEKEGSKEKEREKEMEKPKVTRRDTFMSLFEGRSA